RRFLEEAQLTAQLQHPGVPAVYEVGALPDGRPFCAMKLVEGTTLAELLARRKSPSEDPARWLAVFEQVAQTVSYAHSRGVAPRDLTPANVRAAGPFGEVQVMDWGHAKRTGAGGQGPGAREEERATAPRTQAGAVVGVPAYLAPEQARGDLPRVDERADV